MNIFYFFKELDTPMYQWQRTNLIDELIRNGHKVKTFNPLDYQSIEEANAITVPSIKKWGKCDLFLTCDDQDTIFKETVEEINKMGIPMLGQFRITIQTKKDRSCIRHCMDYFC